MTVIVRRGLALALVVVLGVAAVSAAGAVRTRRFGITGVFSPLHESSSDGAVQDTHWSEHHPADSTQRCSFGYTTRGRQIIDFGSVVRARRIGRRAVITVHPNGVVTPRDWAIPARVTRTSGFTNDPVPADCPGGTGGLHTTTPPSKGGCGTLEGTAHLHLFMAMHELQLSGRFVPLPLAGGYQPFAGCDGPPFPREDALEIIAFRVPLHDPVFQHEETPYQRTRTTLLAHPGRALFDVTKGGSVHYRYGSTVISFTMSGRSLGR